MKEKVRPMGKEITPAEDFIRELCRYALSDPRLEAVIAEG